MIGKNYYINGMGCVSTQNSVENFDFDNFEKLSENVVHAFKPEFKKYINPALIRRMSIGVKMGVVASSMAMKQANIADPEAIITGTGMGCLKDSDKFLKNIVDNNEQYLTPTAFIQSTHNTVGAQIALGLECKSYNVTYVHGATSFESALIDSQLMLNEGASNVLVGAVDELGEYTTNLYKLIDQVKKETLRTPSKGAVFSEGSQFFVLQDQISDSSYAKLLDVSIYNKLDSPDVTQKLNDFLENNDMRISDLDAVVLGINDDMEYDPIYENLQNSILKNTLQLHYKHVSGDYNSVSAFGMWMACHVLKKQSIPDLFKWNNEKYSSIKKILLYNQYRGANHSFILLGSC